MSEARLVLIFVTVSQKWKDGLCPATHYWRVRRLWPSLAKTLDVFFLSKIDVNWKFPWHLTCAYSVIQDIQVDFLHQRVSMAGWRHFAKSAVCSQEPWAGRSHKLEESLRTHFTTQTIWHLVMLCQYVGAQDGCCYYFVISTFGRETSEISLPCARMSTNDRTVGKEQQICYRLTESRDGLESRWASAAQLAARRSFRSHHQHSWCTTYKCMQYRYIGTRVMKKKKA